MTKKNLTACNIGSYVPYYREVNIVDCLLKFF